MVINIALFLSFWAIKARKKPSNIGSTKPSQFYYNIVKHSWKSSIAISRGKILGVAYYTFSIDTMSVNTCTLKFPPNGFHFPWKLWVSFMPNWEEQRNFPNFLCSYVHERRVAEEHQFSTNQSDWNLRV